MHVHGVASTYNQNGGSTKGVGKGFDAMVLPYGQLVASIQVHVSGSSTIQQGVQRPTPHPFATLGLKRIRMGSNGMVIGTQWGPVGSSGIQWDLVGSGGIQWDLVGFSGIQ